MEAVNGFSGDVATGNGGGGEKMQLDPPTFGGDKDSVLRFGF